MGYQRLSPPFDGSKLRALRQDRGLTLKGLEDLTAKAGRRVRASMISRYENGEFGPSAPRAKVIASALDCTIDDLLTPASEDVRECA